MKVTTLQMDIIWAQPDKNQAAADKLITNNPGSDLYVLPEMWSTGFITDPRKHTPYHDDSLKWMKETAIKNKCAICGSLSVKDVKEDKYRNRLYFVFPDGTYIYYDKHHLFSYGGEDALYIPGDKRVIVEYMNIRFLLQICYDLRFPSWMRYKDDYDAIIIVANWPQQRKDAWDILLKARAVENQCYVIAANRTGRDEHCIYDGGSVIIDAKGHALTEATDNREQVITTEIDINRLNKFRSVFPVLKDRDIF